jgi:hypothetical protein
LGNRFEKLKPVSKKMFEHFRVGKFTLRLRALADLHLPAYKGSTLRGGFGQALKEVTCALKRQNCQSCLLKDRCVYLYLFETPPPADAEMMRLYPSAPHPFVIEPPIDGVQTIPEGGTLTFGLTLIGRALDYLPYFVYAFIHLGERGLGRGRGKFFVEEVLADTDRGLVAIYDVEGKSLRQEPQLSISERVQQRATELAGGECLSIDFLTPTRIKFDGHLVEKPEFHHLMRSLLRRLSSLSYFHCGAMLDLDFRGIIKKAQGIEIGESDLRWHDWERYSSRQKNKMSLGGFLGTISFEGDFSEFFRLLCLGELVHLGKAASFGLGRYRISTDSGMA